MKSKIHFHEFALLMALLMSIVSFSIDAVLPALGEIGRVFILQNSNQAQWVIISIFSRHDHWSIDSRTIVRCDWTETDFIYRHRDLLFRKLVVLFHAKF